MATPEQISEVREKADNEMTYSDEVIARLVDSHGVVGAAAAIQLTQQK